MSLPEFQNKRFKKKWDLIKIALFSLELAEMMSEPSDAMKNKATRRRVVAKISH